MPPASVMTIDSTEAKIGRSMKKLENTRHTSACSDANRCGGTRRARSAAIVRRRCVRGVPRVSSAGARGGMLDRCRGLAHGFAGPRRSCRPQSRSGSQREHASSDSR